MAYTDSDRQEEDGVGPSAASVMRHKLLRVTCISMNSVTWYSILRRDADEVEACGAAIGI